MANIRYTVPCPSCEAEVTIRDSAEVGKKKECPKCKYRFTVPEQTGDGAGSDAAEAKSAKKGKKDKKKAKGGNGLLVGVVLGVLALGGLATAGYFILGGEDPPKPSPVARNTSGGGAGAAQSTAPAGEGTPTTSTGSPDGGDKSADTGKGEGDKPAEGSGESKPAEKPAEAPKSAVAAKPGDEKDVTNLLPGDTRAVYRVNFDRLKQSATPIYSSVFDNYVQGLFQTSLTIPFDEVQTYIHCVVDPDRDAFGVIRTKSPFDRARLYQQLQLEKPANLGSAKRDYFLIKANPFLDAISKAFTLKSVIGLAGLGSTIRLPDPPAADPKAPVKRYALCVYDSTTLFIGAEGIVERFLTDLQDNGYPTFKSELAPEAPPPADPSATPPGESGPGGAPGLVPVSPGGPGASLLPKSDYTMVRQGRTKPGPPSVAGGEGPAPDGQTGGRKAPRKLYTSVPTYRTIAPALKRLLNQLEEDAKNPPAVLYAELVDQQLLGARRAGELFRATADPLAGLASRVQLIGGVLSQFDKDKGVGRLALEFVSDDEARRATSENIRPILNLIKLVADTSLSMQTTISGGGGDAGGSTGGGAPGMEGIGSGRGGNDDSGRGGSGGRRPPGGFEGPGGSPDGGADPAGGQPGTTGTFLDDGKGTVNIGQSDRVVTVNAEMNWPEEKFATVLIPRVARTGGQVRGRIAVQSGDADWHSLAAAPSRMGKDKKPFPRGTMERELKEERYRLPFPPEQRVSFLAELLPYLGKAGLRQQIQEKKGPWYGKDNIGAAETWVPEFLVPYYPQESWRAEHPKAEGRQLGGTNYVAPAGLGMDAGRYDPANPDHAKKVGITGYDWGSKPEEVTDGLSNTAYLLQVSPEYKQAWIAGGGSTVRGVDENDPMNGYTHRAPDGRRGTYALMADGSVRWIPQGTDPKVFKGLVTRAGGESLGDLDKLAPPVKPTRKETELKSGGGLPEASATKPANNVDANELKKFQGKWKVTFAKAKIQGKPVTPEMIDQLKLEISFDGPKVAITANGPSGRVTLGTADVTRLDPKASPKILDDQSMVGGKAKPSLGVYEFVGDNKLKVRASNDGKPRPTSVSAPDDKSDDEYNELERVQ